MSNDAMTTLTLDLRQLAPETKYFLIGLINLYPLEQAVVFKVRDLADTLAIPDSVVTSGIPELEVSQLVSIGTEVGDGGETKRTLTVSIGRASVYARSTGAKKKQSHSPKTPPCRHNGLIESLLLTPRREYKKSNNEQAASLKQSHEVTEKSSQISNQVRQNFRHKLTISNRLLLMVLLRYADPYGVVRGLGMTDIEYLTGIKQSKLEGQFEKLKQAGYIRASYSGISSKAMFGVTTGGYFLNLSHAGFGDRSTPSITLVYETPRLMVNDFSIIANEARSLIDFVDQFRIHVDILDNECQLARSETSSSKKTGVETDKPYYKFGKPLTDFGHQLRNKREYPRSNQLLGLIQNCHPNIPLSLDYRRVTPFFECPSRDNFARFLQVRIDQLVSLLMTEFWAEIDNKDLKLTDSIKETIQELFLPKRKHPIPPLTDLPDSNSDLNTLLALIFETAIMVCERLQTVLKHIDIVQEDWVFVILPSQDMNRRKTHEYRSLQMFDKPHTGSQRSGHYHLKEEATKKRIAQVNLSKTEIADDEYQINFGLMTKPKKKYDLLWKKT